mmetsp:Transcript_34934/g.108700  ORF Transcript_34934/g.108700 Transcript_34934/m.108700 type:complete len:234 (-) Transcript_34934:966-1667(-)
MSTNSHKCARWLSHRCTLDVGTRPCESRPSQQALARPEPKDSGRRGRRSASAWGRPCQLCAAGRQDRPGRRRARGGAAQGIVLEARVPTAACVLVRRHRRVFPVAGPEICQVSRPAHLRDVRWCQAKPTEGVPIEAAEEGVVPQRRCPESHLGLLAAQGTDEVCSQAPALMREADCLDAALHELVDLLCAVCLERRSAGQQLEEQHAEHPPVHRPAVASAQDHLWSHVVGCTN